MAILAEAGRTPEPGALYGVWASETPKQPLRLERSGSGFALTGAKLFCSGAGLVDRALVTVTLPGTMSRRYRSEGELRLDSLRLERLGDLRLFRDSDCHGEFRSSQSRRGRHGRDAEWYLKRAGFWHGACGPASCWAGGAVGLVDYALKQARDDPHTLAHLGAITASAWGMRSYLDSAGNEIDANPADSDAACTLALTPSPSD